MINVVTAEQAVEILLRGGVGVMPTDTVYGLVARAADRGAVERLYVLKRREHKPGTVIAASVEQLIALGVQEHYLRRVEHLWPAAVSVIVLGDERLVYLHQDRGDFPVRVPQNVSIRKLLEKTGPLVTSSANQPAKPTSINIAEARAYFGDQVDFYLDGGEIAEIVPSTIVRISEEGEYEVLRQGAVNI